MPFCVSYQTFHFQLRNGNGPNALPCVSNSRPKPLSLESKSTAVGVCRLPKISIYSGFFRNPYFLPLEFAHFFLNDHFLQKRFLTPNLRSLCLFVCTLFYSLNLTRNNIRKSLLFDICMWQHDP